jgi:hypothetical protein
MWSKGLPSWANSNNNTPTTRDTSMCKSSMADPPTQSRMLTSNTVVTPTSRRSCENPLSLPKPTIKWDQWSPSSLLPIKSTPLSTPIPMWTSLRLLKHLWVNSLLISPLNSLGLFSLLLNNYPIPSTLTWERWKSMIETSFGSSK